MSHISHYYHIVFRTFQSEFTIPEDTKKVLFKYIFTTCNNHNWKVIRINGFLNHVHLLLRLPATVKVCDVVRELKTSTSKAFRGHEHFPFFKGWAGKYASMSVSYYEVDTIRRYIINQEVHHASCSFHDEIHELLGRNGLDPEGFLKDSDKASGD